MDLSTLLTDGDDSPVIRNAVFNKQSVTSSQVNTLLGVIGNLAMTMRNLSLGDEADDHDHKQGTRADGGAIMALEQTILDANERLVAILKEGHRWDTKGVDSVSESIKAVHRQHISTLKSQQDQIEAELRPVVLLKPQVFLLNGKWWCVHGESIEGRLAGCGDTAYEAVRDFEIKYYQQRAS